MGLKMVAPCMPGFQDLNQYTSNLKTLQKCDGNYSLGRI